MEANFRTTRAALTQAQQDLDYTELRAPFDGTIGRSVVENFEDVLAKLDCAEERRDTSVVPALNIEAVNQSIEQIAEARKATVGATPLSELINPAT